VGDVLCAGALTAGSALGEWRIIRAVGRGIYRNGSIRLITRDRIALTGSSAGQRLGMLVMEPGSLVMERRMLLGIKQRAERLAVEQSSKPVRIEGQ
jgi:hypothetical protein